VASDHAVGLGQQAPAVIEEHPAGKCELDAATRSLEQGDAEQLFESANLVTQ
jgi:hypothetical protein